MIAHMIKVETFPGSEFRLNKITLIEDAGGKEHTFEVCPSAWPEVVKILEGCGPIHVPKVCVSLQREDQATSIEPRLMVQDLIEVRQ